MPGLILSQSVIDLTPPPVAEGSEPDMSTEGQLVYSTGFEEFSSISDLGDANGNNLTIATLPGPATTGGAVDTSKNQLITGRDGVGKATRLLYTGEDQCSVNLITYPEGQDFPINSTHYMQFWFRVDGVQGTTNPDVKFLEGWLLHAVSNRTQWNTRYPVGNNPDTHDPVWEALIVNVEVDEDSQQPVGPYPQEVFDNKWHRFTVSFKSHESSGNKNGFQRAWVDGIKIMDCSQEAVALGTPPGGVKVWCTQAEVDRIPVGTWVDHWLFGGPQTTPQGVHPWTFDIDDVIWRVA